MDTFDKRNKQHIELLKKRLTDDLLKKYFPQSTETSEKIINLMENFNCISRQQCLLCRDDMKVFLNIDLFEELYKPSCDDKSTYIRGCDEVFIVNFINLVSLLENGYQKNFYETVYSITDADFYNYNYNCDKLSQRSAAYKYTITPKMNKFDVIKIIHTKSLFVRKVEKVDLQTQKKLVQLKEKYYGSETLFVRELQNWIQMIAFLDKETKNYAPVINTQLIDDIFAVNLNLNMNDLTEFEYVFNLDICYNKIKYPNVDEKECKITEITTNIDQPNVLKSLDSIFMLGKLDMDINKIIMYLFGQLEINRYITWWKKPCDSYFWGYQLALHGLSLNEDNLKFVSKQITNEPFYCHGVINHNTYDEKYHDLMRNIENHIMFLYGSYLGTEKRKNKIEI